MASAGHRHTVMLRSDGKVAVAGSNAMGQCNLRNNIGPFKQVSAGREHTLLLSNNGDVIALGSNDHNQCSLPNLRAGNTDLKYIQVSAGREHSVALRSDGKAVYAGKDHGGELWKRVFKVMSKPHECDETSKTSIEPKVQNASLNDPELPMLLGATKECGGESALVPVDESHEELPAVQHEHGSSQVHARGSEHKAAVSLCKTYGGRRSVGLPRCDDRGPDALIELEYSALDTLAYVEDSIWELPVPPLSSFFPWSPEANRSTSNKTIKPKVLSPIEEVGSDPAPRYVQVSAGYSHTALLRNDGRAIAFGMNESLQCNLPREAGYLQVSAGGYHTVLLHTNGDALGIGSNTYQQCDLPVRSLKSHIKYVRVSAGHHHTVLLRSDGRVEAVGLNTDGQCDIPPLEDGLEYLQASAGGHHTALLRSDGQVVAVGAQGEISIPAVQKHQSWGEWFFTKPVLPDGVEYVPDSGELPVGHLQNESRSQGER